MNVPREETLADATFASDHQRGRKGRDRFGIV
jgi:hypothetical protein